MAQLHTPARRTLGQAGIRNGHRALGIVVVAALALGALAGCSSSDDLDYSEDRGLFSLDEIRDASQAAGEDGETEAQNLLDEGADLEASGRLRDAVRHYQFLAERYPRRILALEARLRMVRVYVELDELIAAHREMELIVMNYKEYLQQTRSQALWDAMRYDWYDRIGLGLFFADRERTRLAADLDPAIVVFTRLFEEEFRGRYAALCLLRIGDCYMAKRDFRRAREYYVRVIESYPDFNQYHEHEEALYKAARATMGLMKGSDYNLQRLNSRGSETIEKGALNLLDDYQRQYPGGRYAHEVAALLSDVHEVLVWRDFNAARTYDRMGRRDAARMQYEIVVRRWGGNNASRFPDQQPYVQRAERRLSDLGGPLQFEEVPRAREPESEE